MSKENSYLRLGKRKPLEKDENENIFEEIIASAMNWLRYGCEDYYVVEGYLSFVYSVIVL